MMNCPWCHESIEIRDDGTCPECKNNISPDDQHPSESSSTDDRSYVNVQDLSQMIENRFHCAKCKGDSCEVNEVAMTGTGLSKLFDVQYNHYLFVSCLDCGFVEVYNPNVLTGKRAGSAGTALDIIFGG